MKASRMTKTVFFNTDETKTLRKNGKLLLLKAKEKADCPTVNSAFQLAFLAYLPVKKPKNA